MTMTVRETIARLQELDGDTELAEPSRIAGLQRIVDFPDDNIALLYFAQ
jgi:hypothetical protein